MEWLQETESLNQTRNEAVMNLRCKAPALAAMRVGGDVPSLHNATLLDCDRMIRY